MGKLQRMAGTEICVYEYVYEYGRKSGEDGLPTYSYTYSYTRLSSPPDWRSFAGFGSGEAG